MGHIQGSRPLAFVAKVIAADPEKRAVYLPIFLAMETLVEESERREAALERARRLAAS